MPSLVSNMIEETSKKKSTRSKKIPDVYSKLVNPRCFVEATRESGYKSTTHALAELVDNSIQANATSIDIVFADQPDDARDIWVYVLDDGIGMTEHTLELAMQFGGTTRFDDRKGLGRFGMGLPNASVSQCRRFEVYTRRTGGSVLFAYLDLDEIANGDKHAEGFMDPVELTNWCLPDSFNGKTFEHGTLVIWKGCDRLSPKNFDSLRRKVTGQLGQSFRNFIHPFEQGKNSRVITVNGCDVKPFDPLYLDPRSECIGGEEKGTAHYELAIPGRKTETSRVTVRYSMLPVEDWQSLSIKEKNSLRIFANRGFSVVRAGREIEVTDRYFLMGQNDQDGRIMNNDAWWRCEIHFDPVLDEIFGVTHTKQEIHPNVQLLQQMRLGIAATVSTLRSEYEKRRIKKTPNQTHTSEEIAARSNQFLPPAPNTEQKPDEYNRNLNEYLTKTSRDGETKERALERVKNKPFTIELEPAKEGPFYRTAWLGESTILYVNTDHPFFGEIYSALDENPGAQIGVELLLFALARGERQAGPDGKMWYHSQRAVWSAALWAYLNQ